MLFPRLIFVTLFALLLAACNPTPATPAPLPDARDVLSKAAAQVRTSKSLRIKLQLSGAPVYVDTLRAVSFISADGAYLAPDRVRATVVAKILGVAGEVEIVTVGNDQWFKNSILTGGKFTKAVFAPGFNAQTLVTSDTGIEAGLESIRDLKMVGAEKLFNADVYHLYGVASGKDIEALTVGLIRGTLVNCDIYIDQKDSRVVRVVLLQPDTVTEKEPKPTTWLLELYDYDVSIQIEPPVVAAATANGTANAAPPATIAPFGAPQQ